MRGLISKWDPSFINEVSFGTNGTPYKLTSGRHKCNFERSVSEAVQHFGHLCVYKSSGLCKWPSGSRKKPSNLWRSCAANAHLQKKCWRPVLFLCTVDLPEICFWQRCGTVSGNGFCKQVSFLWCSTYLYCQLGLRLGWIPLDCDLLPYLVISSNF